MHFKEKGSRDTQTVEAIELTEFSSKPSIATNASDHKSYFNREANHFPVILSQNPSLNDISNICINLGTPLKMHKFSGALSNSVWKLDLSTKKSVILRIYGESQDLIDRDIELNHFIRLSELSVGPKCLVTFSNGRIEEFLNASNLNSKSIRTESLAIAESLAKFHSISSIKSNLVLWETLEKWYQIAQETLLKHPDLKERVNLVIDFDSLYFEIKRLKTLIGVDCKTVFCHNDLQYGNIMKLKDSRIILIDYEYAGLNYLGYDFANFFCEWMADYNSESPHSLDKTKYPSSLEQEAFITHYLTSKNSTLDEIKNESLEILKKIPVFTAISHLLWGLWGIIHTRVDSDFDYGTYGLNRLNLYAEIKP